MLGLSLSSHRHVAVTFTRGVRAYRATRPQLKGPYSSQANQPTTAERTPFDRIPRYFGYAFACVLGLYISQLTYAVVRLSKDETISDLSRQKDVVGRYDEIADSFDSDVNVSEWLMGIMRKRKSIGKSCKGNVLEVSCGTGRNLGYFDLYRNHDEVNSLTLLDISPQMVEVCKRKFLALRKKGVPDSVASKKEVRFIVGSALNDMPLAPNGTKYDTIVQTMGLCSTPTPAELIVNMARHLELSNPDARIHLLEHGRSYYEWLNKVIDSSAHKHAELYGCWFNRDLDAIVEEAADKAGLEIVRTQRRHVGTTYMYELKAGPNAAKTLSERDAAIEEKEIVKSTWSRWWTSIG